MARKSSILKEKYFIITVLILLFSMAGMATGLWFLTTPAVMHDTEDGYIEEKPEVMGTETEELPASISSHTNRQWVLKQTSLEYSKLIYTVETTGNVEDSPKYTIVETAKEGMFEEISDGIYQAEIDVQDLDTGTYHLQAKASINGEEFNAEPTLFNLSYPLYVAWTMDWEGTDAPDEQLQMIVDFSNKHNVPITHFFNPRIYVTNDISADRANFLTQWVLDRQSEGDGIGLHLHMYYDMVETTGVTVRKEPTWTDYANNGVDVPCTAYTYTEFAQILDWAKAEFTKHGLNIPTSFRAGGWFANSEILRALNDSGFLIDSSGRDYYVWGTKNNKITGFWKLKSTTSPYQPSSSNQNSFSPAPNLSIWEFPNNGADSWWYTSTDLIKRFNDNYQTPLLDQPQTLTYLSHPHWIQKDLEILEPTYEHIDQYLTSSDQGPVVYVTLEQVYSDLIRS